MMHEKVDGLARRRTQLSRKPRTSRSAVGAGILSFGQRIQKNEIAVLMMNYALEESAFISRHPIEYLAVGSSTIMISEKEMARDG